MANQGINISTTWAGTNIIDVTALNVALAVSAGDTTKKNELGAFAGAVFLDENGDGNLTLETDIGAPNKDSMLAFANIVKGLMPATNDGVFEIMYQFENIPSTEDFGALIKYDTDAYKVAPLSVDYNQGNFA